MNELMMDIAESATVHGRLRQAADSHIVALRVKQQESQRMRIRLAKHEAKKKKAESNVKLASNQCDTQQIKVTKAHVPFFGLQERMHILMKCQEGISCPPSIFVVDGLDTDTEALHRRIDKCCFHLLESAKALEASAVLPFGIRAQNAIELAPHELRKELDNCFVGLRGTLNAYSLTEYYPSFSDDFEKDKARLSDLMEVARSLTIMHAAQRWQSTVEGVLLQRKAELNREKQQLAVFEMALREYEERYESARTDFSKWKKAIRDFERDMDTEVERGERFSRYLTDAFDEELAHRRQVMSNEPSVPCRLLQLLSCKQLCDERDKLIFG
jgi:hypothetical protein